MTTPWVSHLKAARQILKYLHGTPNRGLLYQSSKHLHIAAYNDFGQNLPMIENQ